MALDYFFFFIENPNLIGLAMLPLVPSPLAAARGGGGAGRLWSTSGGGGGGGGSCVERGGAHEGAAFMRSRISFAARRASFFCLSAPQPLFHLYAYTVVTYRRAKSKT